MLWMIDTSNITFHSKRPLWCYFIYNFPFSFPFRWKFTQYWWKHNELFNFATPQLTLGLAQHGVIMPDSTLLIKQLFYEILKY